MDTRLLDVAIGLVLVFALTSLMASVLTEVWNNWRQKRGAYLEKTIASMLGDNDKLAKEFFKIPIIQTLYLDERMPSYLEPELFCTGFFELLSQKLSLPLNRGEGTPQEFVSKVLLEVQGQGSGINEPNIGEPVAKTLQSLCAGVGGDWPAFEQRIKQWFDATCARSIGWFTRDTQFTLFVMGFTLAAALNINPIVIANVLWHDPVLRAVVVQQATVIAAERSGKSNSAQPATTPQSISVPVANPAKPTSRVEAAQKLTDAQLSDVIKTLNADSRSPQTVLEIMKTASRLDRELNYERKTRSVLGDQMIKSDAVEKLADDQFQAFDKAVKDAKQSAGKLDPELMKFLERRVEGVRSGIDAERSIAKAEAQVNKPKNALESTGGCSNIPGLISGTLDEAVSEDFKWAFGKLCTLGIPLGWGSQPVMVFPGSPIKEFFMVVLGGFLITAAACILGAQFWFDLLGKLIKLRGAGAKPEPSSSGRAPEAMQPAAGTSPPSNQSVSPFQFSLNEIERGLSDQQIRQIQKNLKMVAGKMSGVLDGNTREEIIRWHQSRNVGNSNQLNAEDVALLISGPDAATGTSANGSTNTADMDEHFCGCDIDMLDETDDEELPQANGGTD